MAEESLTICRLCFSSENDSGDAEFSPIQKYLPFLDNWIKVSEDAEIPDLICSNCEYHIETASLLKKRVELTEIIWNKYKENDPKRCVDQKPFLVDRELYLNCHVCGENTDYQGLQEHIISDHGDDHLTDCDLCRILSGRRGFVATVDHPKTIKSEMVEEEETEETFDHHYDDGNSSPPPSPPLPTSEDVKESSSVLRNLPDCSQTSSSMASPGNSVKGTPKKSKKDIVHYMCEVCNTTSTRRDNIARHIRSQHTGGMSPTRTVLNKMRNSRGQKKSLACPVCDQIMSRPDNLARHLKRFHLDFVESAQYAKLSKDAKSDEISQLIRVVRTSVKETKDGQEEDETSLTPVADPIQRRNRKSRANTSQKEADTDDASMQVDEANDSTHKKKKSSKLFKCMVCETVSDRRDNIKRHIKNRHSEMIPINLDSSDTTIENKYSYEHLEQRTTADGEFLIFCNRCELPFGDEESAKSHIKSYHRHDRDAFGELILCIKNDAVEEEEKKETPKSVTYSDRPGKSKGFKNIPCNVCEVRVSRLDGLRRHILQHKGFSCKRCYFVFSNEDEWLEHEKDYQATFGLLGVDTWQCEKCERRVNSYCELRKHTLSHYGHRCAVCLEIFPSASTLMTHKDVHVADDSVFPCDKCDMVFATSRQKRIHSAKHTEKFCDTCGLMVRGCFRRHAILHKTSRPYKCHREGCGKAFKTKHLLKIHSQIHSDVRPFVCDIGDCRMSFRQYRTLSAHRTTHSSDKRYKCQFDNCDRAFHQSFDLDLHMRRHTGEKPFLCKGCNEAFYTRSLLRKHQQNCNIKIDFNEEEVVEEYTLV